MLRLFQLFLKHGVVLLHNIPFLAYGFSEGLRIIYSIDASPCLNLCSIKLPLRDLWYETVIEAQCRVFMQAVVSLEAGCLLGHCQIRLDKLTLHFFNHGIVSGVGLPLLKEAFDYTMVLLRAQFGNLVTLLLDK